MKKGILYLNYLANLKKVKNNADKQLLIVRSNKLSNLSGMIPTPQLSPSSSLFCSIPRLKNGEFTKEELKVLTENDGTVSDWFFVYTYAFKIEMQKREDMIKALNRLDYLLSQGQSIELICYCKDFYECHRKLIGDYFKDKYEVIYN